MAPDVRYELARILDDTPLQMLEIQQHVAPTHMRGREDGSAHRKPSSRPPMNVDAFDAVRAEERQVTRWSGWLGVQRGSVGQRLSVIRDHIYDLPDDEVEMILSAWLQVRAYSRKRYPTEEDKMFFSTREAMVFVDKSERTLRSWAKNYPNLCRMNGRSMQFKKHVLVAVDEEMKRKAVERGKRLRSTANAQVAG